MAKATPRGPRGLLIDIKDMFLVGVWVGTVMFVGAWLLTALACLALFPKTGAVLTTLFVVFMVIPIGKTTPAWGKQLVAASTVACAKFYSLRVIMDDGATLKPEKSYIFGYEPHSALPVVQPLVFSGYSRVAPKALKGVPMLATSMVFWTPLVRHMWWWLGARPVSRQSMSSLLASGQGCSLVPGGVRELEYMKPGSEVAFLRQRHGFVKLAIQHGTPLVPVVAIGQTNAYAIKRIGPPVLPKSLMDSLSRTIGFAPVYLSGHWGTPFPKKTRITVAVGRPIDVPHDDSPSREVVQKFLDAFITSMQDLYDRHKADAGYPNSELRIV
ncbi:unnamed protein product [Ostreobium quekettii]|uniref:Acyltransferase n=1 Tax=Ostreobium quekettii TaxID=121088 RepID=A0A8S1IQJ9_9CHLO|nr:unnamed protein product [Ostreobium quekettii]|eukprot:evm.model.scf_1254.3 EVM.evm.TU.scf_1254.3   scf_1254:17741-21961(-)